MSLLFETNNIQVMQKRKMSVSDKRLNFINRPNISKLSIITMTCSLTDQKLPFNY